MRTVLTALASIALLALAACGGPRVTPPIPDTPEAKAIIDMMHAYRSAMEARDVEAILSLASTDYRDQMGSPDPRTDVHYEDLAEKLHDDFEQVTRVRLDLEVLRIDFAETAPVANVDYRYDVRYQISMPSGQKWHNSLDVNRMVVRREPDGVWRVISGL